MPEPRASRPYMPGYGVVPADEGRGLLPWTWATERLAASHEYWLATVDAHGRPHVTPVWGLWDDERVWFSCSGDARKARNLDGNAHCAVTTDNALEPVVVEGRATRVPTPAAAARFAELTNAKYAVSYPVDFYLENALFQIEPERVFGLDDADFTGSPTRWVFDA